MITRNRIFTALVLSTSLTGVACRALPPHAADHILIKFRPDAVRSVERIADLPRMVHALDLPPGCRIEEPTFNRLCRTRAGVDHEANPRINYGRFMYLRLGPGLTPADCVAQLTGHPLLEYAEIDAIATGATVVPNDPAFTNGAQWYLTNSLHTGTSVRADSHIPAAWHYTTGSSNVIVAVLDSGISPLLPEFAGRLVPGYDFVNTNASPLDDHGHGTWVTSILAANTSNGIGMAGVDWHCRIMPVKVLNFTNTGTYGDITQGVEFAVSNGAKVINMSLGGHPFGFTLADTIANAVTTGVVCVTVTHNDGTNTIRFPGRMTETITVGASDRWDQRALLSNYGPEIDLVAPGKDIPVLSTNGTILFVNGTSFAAPQVAGVAALLAAVQPGINNEQVRTLLNAGADDMVGTSNDVTGFDQEYGWGRLNAYNTLCLAHITVTSLTFNAGNPVLQWNSPPNASNREPFWIEYMDQPGAFPRTLIPSNSLTYSPGHTIWTDDGSNTIGVFPPRDPNQQSYRIRIKDLVK